MRKSTQAGEVERAGHGRPTDQSRSGPGRPADHDVLRGGPLQPQGVDEHIEEKAAVAMVAASRLVVAHSQANPATPRATPNTRAFDGGTSCRASGLERVLFMIWSMSRST